MEIQKSATVITWIQVLPAKRQAGNGTGSYLEGLENQNGKHLVNLSESNSLKTQVIGMKLAELLT